ncbi:hypothetical protein [Pseudoruegeria sp. SHC-113]|uniref:hypothetical protein n=1 Tax=Pseudoruegeria sp. SHC-113 TaxID=2855439 RepID=UPI0021BA9EFC|nr:hypothetical protein [Pseudoruegeria sp. SHC-113]MCT8159265.1 hypothetical protein [Pseudoruegeria sp. SHC-113]
MRVLQRDQTRAASAAKAADSPARRLAEADGPPPAVPAQALTFSVQIDGHWHAGIRIAPDMAVIEGPIDADSYGEIRDCRLFFPYGRLEISVVRKAEVLHDDEFLGAARLYFPDCRSPARAELAALIRLLNARSRRAKAAERREVTDAALLAAVPKPGSPSGWRARLRLWLRRGRTTAQRPARKDAP